MRTETILRAIADLNKAAAALRGGNLDISAQIRLGSECAIASIQLQHELEQAVPEVKIAA